MMKKDADDKFPNNCETDADVISKELDKNDIIVRDAVRLIKQVYQVLSKSIKANTLK